MIKKYIRKKIQAQLPDLPVESKDKLYHWVIDAPFWQWKDRLWCIKYYNYGSGAHEDAYTWVFNHAPLTMSQQKQTKDVLAQQYDAQMR